MVGDAVKKVECKTCDSHHLYRRPKTERDAAQAPHGEARRGPQGAASGTAHRRRRGQGARARRARRARADRAWEHAIAGQPTSAFKPYRISLTLGHGRAVRHPKFGDGVVAARDRPRQGRDPLQGRPAHDGPGPGVAPRRPEAAGGHARRKGARLGIHRGSAGFSRLEAGAPRLNSSGSGLAPARSGDDGGGSWAEGARSVRVRRYDEEEQKWRRRALIGAGVVVVGVPGLWFAIHEVPGVGPALADGARACSGRGRSPGPRTSRTASRIGSIAGATGTPSRRRSGRRRAAAAGRAARRAPAEGPRSVAVGDRPARRPRREAERFPPPASRRPSPSVAADGDGTWIPIRTTPAARRAARRWSRASSTPIRSAASPRSRSSRSTCGASTCTSSPARRSRRRQGARPSTAPASIPKDALRRPRRGLQRRLQGDPRALRDDARRRDLPPAARHRLHRRAVQGRRAPHPHLARREGRRRRR